MDTTTTPLMAPTSPSSTGGGTNNNNNNNNNSHLINSSVAQAAQSSPSLPPTFSPPSRISITVGGSPPIAAVNKSFHHPQQQHHHHHHHSPSPRQRLHAQQKLHVQTQQLSTIRRKRQTSTFPTASYPHKKVKWVSTKKIAKHKGNLLFYYSTPCTPMSCGSPVVGSASSSGSSQESSGGLFQQRQHEKIQTRKKVYAVLTDKKMELFETSQPFSLPDMICQSPVATPTRILSKFSQTRDSSHSLALLASTNDSTPFQNLIMINENQVPSQYGSEQQNQENVGLLGKIYLCPQICGGRVQVVRAGKKAFRVIITGETPKNGPELNMNQELLTPTSSVQTPMFETPTSYLDPKSPYFSQALHQFTSTSASSPQVGENMTPTSTASPYPYKFPPLNPCPTTLPSPVNTHHREIPSITAHIPPVRRFNSTAPSADDNDEDGDVTMKNAVSPHDDNNHIFGTSRGRFEMDVLRTQAEGIPESQNHENSFSDSLMGSSSMSLMDCFKSREPQESLFFQTESEAECDEWIMHIQQVISSLNNKNAYLLDEILLYIFSFLDAFDLCKSIAPSSVKFMTLAQNEILWNHLYMAQWKKKDYSIMYYSAMLNVSTPYVTGQSANGASSSSSLRNSRRSSVCVPLVTWKYIFTKRFYCEKKFLKKESGANERAAAIAAAATNNQQSTTAPTTEVPESTAPENIDPAELEKRKKEAEERKKKEEEERNKQISSEYLKDGNTLFNAADYEKDVQTKRLLWVFCIDQYDACLIYNPSNWTAARNWAVALIRLEKLVNSYRGEVQQYLKMILELCVSKFEACMELTPNNDEVLTLWAGFLSDLALKIHNPTESDKLFTDAHQKFQQALNIKPYIGTYNDYGISFCDMAEKKIRQLKKRLNISRSATDSMGNGNTSSHVEEEEFDGLSDDEEMVDEEEIEAQKKQILECLEGSSKLYEKCLAIQPDYFHAINNMGFNQKLKIDLIRIGTRDSLKSQSESIKPERKRLVEEACEYFSRCVNIKDFVIARNNWGNILLQEAKEHEGEERFALLQQCIEQYKRAMELEPSNDGCVCRCAIAYLMSAEIRLKDLKKAQLNLDEITKHIRYLQQQQQQKQSVDPELQRKLQEFMLLAQQQHEVVQHLKMQSQRMYDEASHGFLKLKNKGLSLYNLSCLNAVFCKQEEARKCLQEAFEYGYILTAEKLREDSDFDSIRHYDWFKQLLKDLQDREQRTNSSKIRSVPKKLHFK